MYFVKPKNLKVLTSFLPLSGPVYSQLPPMSMHFKHDSSSLIASIWKSGTCFSCPFFDILTQSLHKKTMVFCYQNYSDLLWENIVLVIKIVFWDSRLKAQNLQKFWDHKNNLCKQWKFRAIFGNVQNAF